VVWRRASVLDRLVLVAVLSIFLTVTVGPNVPATHRADVFAKTFAPAAMSSIQSDYRLINVSDYTGETDGERIQKALDDVGPDGAIVFIPEGTWEACNLTAYTNTIVMGSNATVIKRPANTTLPFITLDNQTNFAITGLIFDGQNILGASGVLVSNGTSFQIVNNTFQDVNTNAIHVTGWSGDFVVKNNVLVNSNNAPILVFGTPGSRIVSRFLIMNNTLMDSRENGKIGVAFADNGTVADNYVVNSTYGVATRCVSNISITNNRIENVTSFGIYLGTQLGDYGSSDIMISNNYVVGSNVGIARYYGSGSVVNVTVKNNTIVYSNQSDVYADFQASFVNNTFTSRGKVRLFTAPAEFAGNVDVNSTPVIPADITGNSRVDMHDVGIVARLYGATRGSGNWNPLADVIENGVIDMRDIAFVAQCFAP